MARVIQYKEFRKLMEDAGLAKVLLVKGEGFFYLASDDEETALEIASLQENAIYVCAFNHQTPEQWVKDIKHLLENIDLK